MGAPFLSIGSPRPTTAACTPGIGGNPPSNLLERVSRLCCRVTRIARVRFEDRDPVDREAGAHGPGGAQHLEEDAGSAEQQNRHGHLQHDQRVLERQPATIRCSRLAVAVQRRQQVDPGGLERRRETEGHAGDERERDREDQDAVVEAQIDDHRQIERAERANAPPREKAAGGASGCGQQQALGQQMTNELSARRAHGQPNGHFLRARGAAHEQQRRQVAARDRQHKADDTEQQRRDGVQETVHLRVDTHVAGREHRDALAWILFRVFGGQPGAQDAHRGLRLRDGDAVAEPSLDEEHGLVRTSLERARRRAERRERRDRQPEVGDEADVDRASVTGGTNPHDCDRDTFDADGSADHRRIRIELPRPRLVADHADHRAASDLLGSGEPASERRPQTQDGQIRRSRVLDDRRPQAALALIVHAKRHHRGGRALEDIGARCDVQIDGVRVPIDASGVGGVLINVDEPAGIRERLGAKEGGVNQAEDGGIGADAEAQDRDGRDGEPPVAEQPADTVLDVARQRIGLITHVFRL